MTDVKPLKEFLRNQRLRWFEDIERMSKKKSPAMAMKIMMKGKKEDLRHDRWRLGNRPVLPLDNIPQGHLPLNASY